MPGHTTREQAGRYQARIQKNPHLPKVTWQVPTRGPLTSWEYATAAMLLSACVIDVANAIEPQTQTRAQRRARSRDVCPLPNPPFALGNTRNRPIKQTPETTRSSLDSKLSSSESTQSEPRKATNYQQRERETDAVNTAATGITVAAQEKPVSAPHKAVRAFIQQSAPREYNLGEKSTSSTTPVMLEKAFKEANFKAFHRAALSLALNRKDTPTPEAYLSLARTLYKDKQWIFFSILEKNWAGTDSELTATKQQAIETWGFKDDYACIPLLYAVENKNLGYFIFILDNANSISDQTLKQVGEKLSQRTGEDNLLYWVLLHEKITSLAPHLGDEIIFSSTKEKRISLNEAADSLPNIPLDSRVSTETSLNFSPTLAVDIPEYFIYARLMKQAADNFISADTVTQAHNRAAHTFTHVYDRAIQSTIRSRYGDIQNNQFWSLNNLLLPENAKKLLPGILQHLTAELVPITIKKALFAAAKNLDGDTLDFFQDYLLTDKNKPTRDSYQHSLLHYAIQNRTGTPESRLTIVHYLLQHGSDIRMESASDVLFYLVDLAATKQLSTLKSLESIVVEKSIPLTSVVLQATSVDDNEAVINYLASLCNDGARGVLTHTLDKSRGDIRTQQETIVKLIKADSISDIESNYANLLQITPPLTLHAGLVAHEFGDSPLHVAVRYGSVDMVRAVARLQTVLDLNLFTELSAFPDVAYDVAYKKSLLEKIAPEDIVELIEEHTSLGAWHKLIRYSQEISSDPRCSPELKENLALAHGHTVESFKDKVREVIIDNNPGEIVRFAFWLQGDTPLGLPEASELTLVDYADAFGERTRTIAVIQAIHATNSEKTITPKLEKAIGKAIEAADFELIECFIQANVRPEGSSSSRLLDQAIQHSDTTKVPRLVSKLVDWYERDNISFAVDAIFKYYAIPHDTQGILFARIIKFARRQNTSPIFDHLFDFDRIEQWAFEKNKPAAIDYLAEIGHKIQDETRDRLIRTFHRNVPELWPSVRSLSNYARLHISDIATALPTNNIKDIVTNSLGVRVAAMYTRFPVGGLSEKQNVTRHHLMVALNLGTKKLLQELDTKVSLTEWRSFFTTFEKFVHANPAGFTYLHSLVSFARPEAMQLIFNKAATLSTKTEPVTLPFDQKNLDSQSPLQLAFELRRADMLDVMLTPVKPEQMHLLTGNHGTSITRSIRRDLTKPLPTSGDTCLALALTFTDEQVALKVLALLPKNYDINQSNGVHEAPIVYALLNGHVNSARALIQRGAMIPTTPLKLRPHMTIAESLVRSQSIALLKEFFTDTAAIDIPNPQGETPLLIAHKLKLKTVKHTLLSMLRKKTGQISTEQVHETLFEAARQNEKVLVRQLLDEVDQCESNAVGQTLLMVALEKGHSTLAARIAEKHADKIDLHARDNAGNSALHYAASCQNAEAVIGILADNGVSMDATNIYGCTAQDVAEQWGLLDLVPTLPNSEDLYYLYRLLLELFIEPITGPLCRNIAPLFRR